MSYLSNICEMTESKTAYCNLTEKTYNIQNVAFLVPFRRIDLGHFTFPSLLFQLVLLLHFGLERLALGVLLLRHLFDKLFLGVDVIFQAFA